MQLLIYEYLRSTLVGRVLMFIDGERITTAFAMECFG